MHAVTGYDNNPGNNDQIYTYYRKLGKNTNLSLVKHKFAYRMHQ